MPKNVTLAKSTVISSISHRNSCTQQTPRGRSRFGEWILYMGPISPLSAKVHRFILAVTDYFSKWAEAIPLREVKTSDFIQFIKHHVIYRFGVPRWIVHDNGPQFISYSFQRFCAKFRIQSISSTT